MCRIVALMGITMDQLIGELPVEKVGDHWPTRIFHKFLWSLWPFLENKRPPNFPLIPILSSSFTCLHNYPCNTQCYHLTVSCSTPPPKKLLLRVSALTLSHCTYFLIFCNWFLTLDSKRGHKHAIISQLLSQCQVGAHRKARDCKRKHAFTFRDHFPFTVFRMLLLTSWSSRNLSTEIQDTESVMLPLISFKKAGVTHSCACTHTHPFSLGCLINI